MGTARRSPEALPARAMTTGGSAGAALQNARASDKPSASEAAQPRYEFDNYQLESPPDDTMTLAEKDALIQAQAHMITQLTLMVKMQCKEMAHLHEKLASLGEKDGATLHASEGGGARGKTGESSWTLL